jgi:hypothetical protein
VALALHRPAKELEEDCRKSASDSSSLSLLFLSLLNLFPTAPVAALAPPEKILQKAHFFLSERVKYC